MEEEEEEEKEKAREERGAAAAARPTVARGSHADALAFLPSFVHPLRERSDTRRNNVKVIMAPLCTLPSVKEEEEEGEKCW